MTRTEIVNLVLKEKIVAILRLDDEKSVLPVVNALAEGGVKVLEITMGTPGGLKWIKSLTTDRTDLLVGVGTVLDEATARLAILAGAAFIVTPVFKTEIIHMAHRYNVPVFMGAFSPTEILECFEAGVDIVKVFPAEVLGMAYIKAIKAPMPQLQLMPTGGVTVENAADWMKAGASALGVGGGLVNRKLIQQQNFEQIKENARQMVANISNLY